MDYCGEINSLIESLGIKENWIADQLEMKTSVLSFLLHERKKIDVDLYEKMKSIIDSYQFSFDLTANVENDNYDLFLDEKINRGIGNRIRVFGKKKFGTLKKLAEAMQISPQQLQQYLSGKREPGSKILIKLLRLGCDINWLLGASETYESYKIYKLEKEIKEAHESLEQISKIINNALQSN